MASKAKTRAAAVAQQNLQIFDDGGYEGPSGWVDLADAIDDALMDTQLMRPQSLRGLMRRLPAEPLESPPVVHVTDETTQQAARRLVVEEGITDLVLLNFASARNPGGGFIGGAKAQEEDLARASALYACLTTEEAAPYYGANDRASALYTDHMIYSPRVPFFRGASEELLDSPFEASIITAPAPNARAHLDRGGAASQIEETMRRRIGMVLALAEAENHRNLILGAWGCGVFRNDPVMVADAFGRWLEDHRFARSFERVVFAVYDRKGASRDAFVRRLT